MSGRPSCWVAANLPGNGPCDGHLIRAHLIPKQRIRRALESDAWRRGQRLTATELRKVKAATLYDVRSWVWMCGGPTGVGGHHGMLDYARTLRIPRHVLPPELEEFAVEYGLEWSLERDYGPKR